MSIRCGLGVLLLALAGCASGPEDKAMMSANATLCEEPRPQVCTADYRPVCGNLQDGSNKTYSNGCSACGDVNVVSWVENACPE